MPSTMIIMLIALILGLASGAIMHRSSFCLAGMFRDLFLFRNSPLLRSLVLLVATSMLLFELARLGGLLQHINLTTLFGTPSLANLLGGVLFGVGMVLAGGCVFGTLYKFAAGSLPGAVALLGLLLGSVLYAEIHPGWQQFASSTQLSLQTTLAQLLNLPQTVVLGAVFFGLASLLWRWQRSNQLTLPSVVKGYLQPRTAALLLAVTGSISLTLLGMPLGITTGYAKAGGWVESLLFPQHVAGLSFFQGQPLKYYSPVSQQTLSAGAGPFFDGIALIQFPLIVGILLGANASALLLGKFKFRYAVPRPQLLAALVGGILMGLAARMTPACNIWHLFGGLPLLSLQSILFTLGLFPGAWVGTGLLKRFIFPAGETERR